MSKAVLQRTLLAFGAGFALCTPVLATNLAATLDWARRVELGTPVSGVISEVRVQPGQQVRKDELLLRLDPRGFQARVSAAGAFLEAARLRRAEAQRELNRADELHERTLLSDHERQVAEIAAATAEARYRRAEALLAQRRMDLEFSELRAPFDGLVVGVSGAPGEAVVSGLEIRTLVVVADNLRMRAKTQVSTDQMRRLQPGQLVQVDLAGTWSDARVEYQGWGPLRQTPQETLYDLHVIFDNPADRALRAGQPVMVRLND